ncbi:hypothetical protein TNCV_3411141 [Trichonephila clavipes]|nr:hypothetical protein TNCV_3411141 [Trichonephila clavipes]
MTTKPYRTTVQTQATIKKRKYLIEKENPPTQRFVTGMFYCNVLTVFGEEIPVLNGKDKVELGMDKASSYMSKLTAAYLANKESETETKCIPFVEISVKLSDVSSFNVCTFGLLKRVSRKRHMRNFGMDLGKTIQEEWSKIAMTVL